jgi:spermidine synthase
MESSISQLGAILAIVWPGFFVSLCLFDLYRIGGSSPRKTAATRWIAKWDFSLEDLGGFSYPRLALVSLLGLFLELLMIRWISSEIRVFAYFKNFVLIACFLGFGLGCYFCRRRINLLPMIAPLVLFALWIKLPWEGLQVFIWNLPIYLGRTSEVNLWGVPSLPLDANSVISLVEALIVIVPLFAMLALIFVPIGQMVGWCLEKAENGVWGYTVNVVSSLAGILLYTALCFYYQPPAVWFVVAGALLLLLLAKVPRVCWMSAAGLAACIALLSLGPGGDKVTYWSPYQKLTLNPVREANRVVSYQLTTNDVWYQQIVDLSPAFVAAHADHFAQFPIEWNAYNIPYHFFPQPASVLVLGAGMGNDVAAALRNGAGRVTAVEIDPLILEEGRRLHFEKPYESPRVTQVVDDARSYIQNSKDRFDLIVFSLLDSHTTSSHFSNIRIDNYVYTVEALTAARQMLKPDGVFIVKFQVFTPWIAGRLDGLLHTVFGRPPLQLEILGSFSTTSGRFFITGSQDKIAQAMSDPKLAAFVAGHRDFTMEKATLTTDDWPYFYQHEPGLPASVILISAVLILLCWWVMGKTGTGGRSMQWHFFFLGAGFLLLEAQIISKAALLFGTTWVVNSIVISGLLVLIVGANVVVGFRPVPVRLAYAGIFGCMLVSYTIPIEKFLFQSVWLKVAAATAVLCLPVFFACLVFVQSFARAAFSGQALGSNLFGALVGGLLESLSMWTGLKSLLVIAGLLYVASYLALRERAAVKAGALEAAAG